MISQAERHNDCTPILRYILRTAQVLMRYYRLARDHDAAQGEGVKIGSGGLSTPHVPSKRTGSSPDPCMRMHVAACAALASVVAWPAARALAVIEKL